MSRKDEPIENRSDTPCDPEPDAVKTSLRTVDTANAEYLRRLREVANPPLVSVVIPTFRRPALLRNAILSLVEQTYTQWEAWVINDGGAPLDLTDGSLPTDDRITVINRREHRERSFCRNLGISLSRGQFVSFLDDDDIFYRHHLELAVRTLNHGEIVDPAVLYTRSHWATAKRHEGKVTVVALHTGCDEQFDRRVLMIRNYIPLNTLVFDKRVFVEGEQFDEALHCLEDWDFLIRLSGKHKFEHLGLLTTQVRRYANPTCADRRRHARHYHLVCQKNAGSARVDSHISKLQDEQGRSLVLEAEILEHAEELPSCSILVTVTERPDSWPNSLKSTRQRTAYGRAHHLWLVTPAVDEPLPPGLLSDREVLRVSESTSYGETLIRAAERCSSDLLLVLHPHCTPLRIDWLTEMIKVYTDHDAGIVSGLVMNPEVPFLVHHASICLNDSGTETQGLYADFPLLDSLFDAPRTADAIGEGMILVSRADFLTHVTDPDWSPTALWIDLCAAIRKKLGRHILVHPRARGRWKDAARIPGVGIGLEEIVKLGRKWGKDFLRREEQWCSDDGIAKRPPADGHMQSPNLPYRETVEWVDALIAGGNYLDAFLVLRPLLRIYRSDQGMLRQLRMILRHADQIKANPAYDHSLNIPASKKGQNKT